MERTILLLSGTGSNQVELNFDSVKLPDNNHSRVIHARWAQIDHHLSFKGVSIITVEEDS